MKAPVAERRPVTKTVHGVSLTSDYAWMRDDNWQQVLRDPGVLSPDIRDHLLAENAYAAHVLGPTDGLRDILFEEAKARLKPDDSTVPAPDGPFAYYSRFREGGQHRLQCRQPRQGGEETVLLDGDQLAAGKDFFQMGDAAHSPDHARVAWSVDERGSEFYTIHVLDTIIGVNMADAVPDTTGSVVWLEDASAFYYVRVDENHRPSRVFRHRLGTPVAEDVLVYEEADPGMFVAIGVSQSRRYGLIAISDHETAEAHLLDLSDAAAKPQLVAAREIGVRYEVEHHPSFQGEDRLLILTNADGAEDFKIVSAPTGNPVRSAWRDLVPHAAGRMILSYGVLKDYLVRLERQDGLPRIVAHRIADGADHSIAFDEEAYSLGLDVGLEFEPSRVRFTYSSMTTPAQTYDYDLDTRERVLRKQQEVPSGHDASLYRTRRIFAPAADGETVPISLLYHRDTPIDGSAPCLLYGYGAYGISIPAAFSTTALSLVNRGFIYAVAHIRGGTEKGWRWYREGKLTRKTNTFSDFIAAGEHLVATGHTSRGRIVAQGGSAGGMLMGAVANRAPDLFAAIVAEVPFVDVMTTMLDDTLPLTPPEWPEWGNPIEDEEAFRTILAYSPIENVAAQAYPPVLVLAGLTDPRVTWWEPAKWVATLRARKTNDAPVLFRCNMSSGHAGSSGRFERLKEVALIQAFALSIVGRGEKLAGEAA
jgi:oligopeptidase B